MAVGQPSDPAPTRCARQRRGRWPTAASAIPTRWACAALREAISRTTREHYGLDVSAGADRRDHRFVRGLQPRLPGDVRCRRPRRDRRARLSCLPQHHGGARHRGGRDRDSTAPPISTPRICAAAHAEKPLKGVLFASPANPTGAMIRPPTSKDLVETARDLGIAVISDEIYHRLAYAAPDVTALAFGDDVDGHQLVLEILLHDRLAHRLDGAARSAGAAGRAHRSRASTSRRRSCRRSPRSRPSRRPPSSKPSRRAMRRTATC